MTYELLQELRAAGFNQHGRGRHQELGQVIPSGQVVLLRYDNISTEDNVYEPTLSELIEACGDEFVGLKRTENDWNTWQVIGGTKGESMNMWYADSPEEAVARLWLSLNKKHA